MYVFDKDYFTYQEILEAYLGCRQRKRNTAQAMKYELDFENNLLSLLNKINRGEYVIGTSNVFTITDPKPREIWAANFEDRIVHHLIYNTIHTYFENRFIEDTYSCIPERGTLKAVQRAYEFMRKASQNNSKPTFCAKIDIKNFFVSINKNILWNKLQRIINPNCLLGKLIQQNVFYNPTKHYRISKKSDLSIVPKHKSLFNVDSDNYGLPIGNLTSQFYSNIYLDGLDKFCKHILKARYYIRYVDDILLFGNDKQLLSTYIRSINQRLITELELSLHQDKILIIPTKHGVPFLGQVIYPYGFRSGKRTLTRFKSSALNGDILSIQSYKGLLKHGKNFNIIHGIFHTKETKIIS